MLGATSLTVFGDVLYLVVPLAAASIILLAHRTSEQCLRRPMQWCDATGLGLFAVTGAMWASAFEVSAVGAVLIGAITSTGGGIIRDVLANDPLRPARSPSVVRRRCSSSVSRRSVSAGGR